MRLLLLALLLFACVPAPPNSSETPTALITPSASETALNSEAPTPTDTPSNTPEPPPTNTPTLTPTLTPTPTPTPVKSPLASFPGAQGYGAQSVGGRGGNVIEVTNLNDSGTGSLRACIEALGKRTCVFRVSGIITLSREIIVCNSFLTIAGQTSPGGITLRAIAGSERPLLLFPARCDAHDIIIRYVRFRHGSGNADAKVAKLNIGIQRGYNIIIDHNSFSWSSKDNVGIYYEAGGTKDITAITISRNLLAEGLYPHSTNLLVGGDGDDWQHIYNLDIHHNLLVHTSHRNPRITCSGCRDLNNVVYNWNDRVGTTTLGAVVDHIGNYWRSGPMSNRTHLMRHQSSGCPGCPAYSDTPALYVAGNYSEGLNANVIIDHYGNVPIPVSWYRHEPLPDAVIPVDITSAALAYVAVMSDVGANKRLDCNGEWVSNVDSVDARVMQDVRNGTGWDDLPTDRAGVYPTHEQIAPCLDTDRDGMPNQWEFQRGLNPNAASDRNGDADGDGFTNLEEYLNG